MMISIVRHRKITRIAVTAALLVVALIQGACDYKPPVMGQEDVLVFIVSDADRPLLEPLLLNVFDREIMTPAPEPIFKIKWAQPEEFAAYRHFKNLVVAAVANPVDSTGDVLTRKILGSERILAAVEGGNPLFLTSDYMATGQMFMGLYALDAIHAQQELTRLNHWIFDQFDQQLRIRQHKYIYSRRENRKLARKLAETYGWQMRFEQDYLIVKERPRHNFVWLGRGYPYRWLSVHWIDGADSVRMTKNWAWDKMDFIAEGLYGSIYIDTLFKSIEPATEKGHDFMILRGVWAHKEQTAGGPFLTMIVRDDEENRIYFLTGIVFNPGGLKSILLKRLEVILRTFHTFDKPADTGGERVSNLT